ncbi:helix-turn-helix domain-containing protein [Pseudooceanicola sp.]|uniref:helix-turn-helix domain-containing protein n=1 Tax=Pseudooceanicola sp. TaxID=1914328 RepID=UPI0040592EF6
MDIETKMVTDHYHCMANASKALLPTNVSAEMRPDRIGYRMSLLRRALGLEKSEISDSLGIERTYWSRFENGKRPITETVAAMLVDRYGVTLDFLILNRWGGLPLDLAEKMRSIAAEDTTAN